MALRTFMSSLGDKSVHRCATMVAYADVGYTDRPRTPLDTKSRPFQQSFAIHPFCSIWGSCYVYVSLYYLR